MERIAQYAKTFANGFQRGKKRKNRLILDNKLENVRKIES